MNIRSNLRSRQHEEDSRWDDCLLQGLICVPLAWLKPHTSLWLWPTSLLWPLKGWTQIFKKQSSFDVFAELMTVDHGAKLQGGGGVFPQLSIYFRPFVGVTLYYWCWLNDLVDMIPLSEWPKNLHVIAETPTKKTHMVSWTWRKWCQDWTQTINTPKQKTYLQDEHSNWCPYTI